jgi:diazepam-binding inhibitor (GABA receptor modulator, acyl-CoA-binding protein)|tara:strand:- start:1960 stop:2220 length:261 start_codon:yes stop_codon:yes gene_type:complete
MADNFQILSEKIKNTNKFINNEDKLELYKYYKQYTIGNCNTEKPSMYQITENYKWNAWNNIKNMDKKSAMNNYIRIATNILNKNVI